MTAHWLLNNTIKKIKKSIICTIVYLSGISDSVGLSDFF